MNSPPPHHGLSFGFWLRGQINSLNKIRGISRTRVTRWATFLTVGSYKCKYRPFFFYLLSSILFFSSSFPSTSWPVSPLSPSLRSLNSYLHLFQVIILLINFFLPLCLILIRCLFCHSLPSLLPHVLHRPVENSAVSRYTFMLRSTIVSSFEHVHVHVCLSIIPIT